MLLFHQGSGTSVFTSSPHPPPHLPSPAKRTAPAVVLPEKSRSVVVVVVVGWGVPTYQLMWDMYSDGAIDFID